MLYHGEWVLTRELFLRSDDTESMTNGAPEATGSQKYWYPTVTSRIPLIAESAHLVGLLIKLRPRSQRVSMSAPVAVI